MFKTLSWLEGPEYWKEKKVLDIGSNTSGLSIEIARAGATVIALEPDPYNNTIALSNNVVEKIISNENLDIHLMKDGLCNADKYGDFDAILFLGQPFQGDNILRLQGNII